MPTSYWNHNAAYYPWVARATRGCRRVLDVGCGTGELALMLARDGRRVTGIDPSEQCIARAKSQAADGDARFVVASLDNFQTDGAFDAVTFVASIHHLDMDAAIVRAKDLLTPGGVIAIVGLASASSPLDHAIDALRVVPSWVSSRLHRMRSSEELGIPTSYAMPTMAQVRDVASLQLPGATVRLALHWRYLLSWKKA